MEKFQTAGQWRIYENTRELMERGTDPPAVLIDHGHRHGIEVFLSMRVNDIHDGRLPEGDPLLSPIKLSHPDWLLGLTDNPYAGEQRTVALRLRLRLDEVRQYRLAIAEEASIRP